MKVLLIGGHLSPLLAVIDALPKNAEVLVVGRKYAIEGDNAVSLEYKTLQKKGIPFVTLTTGRLQRKLTWHTLPSLLKIPYGFWQAIIILSSFKSDVIVSFGGYVSLPVILAGYFLRIPIVIHEQTLEAGAANKIAARFAQKICISWKSSEEFFPKEKILVTGNPLRKFQISNFKYQISKGDKKLPIIYITGGSLGAHAINVIVEECLEQLLEKFVVVHQTGDAKQYNDFERLEKKRQSLSKPLQDRYKLVKFINPEEVMSIMSKATLIVGRSGINTATEVIALGKPCLFIPLPHGQRNEQMTNALFVQHLGISEIALQETLTSEKLVTMIVSMVEKRKEYETQAEKAKKSIVPYAAEKIVDVITYVANKTKK